MNIRFLKNCGFTVIESVDDNGEPTSQYDETFITDEADRFAIQVDGMIIGWDENGKDSLVFDYRY